MLTKKPQFKGELKNPTRTPQPSFLGLYGERRNNTTPTRPNPTKTPSTKRSPAQKKNKTRITVKYDVGFNNTLFVRGTGANLSWERGIPLKNVRKDEWIWETTLPFNQCEFKVLINDQHFESGDNHRIKNGSSLKYTPNF